MNLEDKKEAWAVTKPRINKVLIYKAADKIGVKTYHSTRSYNGDDSELKKQDIYRAIVVSLNTSLRTGYRCQVWIEEMEERYGD